ncbi:hypothetical protein C8J56DRAFT_884307 [Mycena floridula]|nr:hypothetical protein C8J56DRAFT_884307 [Mycena floridula]
MKMKKPIAPGPSNLSRHGRGYMPASTILFGRDPDVDFIVNQLIWQPQTRESKCARFAILGTGGMGKTAVAVKVVDTKNTLNTILNELQSSDKPMILLFDNFETPWNAPGARAEVTQFLRDIDAIPHVAIFVTMRATIPPCEEISWKEMRIQPLDPEASFQLYTGIDTKAQDDEKLFGLLEMLGHMPLAVKLMARQGRSTGCTIEQLMESYQKTGTAMLGPSKNSDAQNSVSISISLSVNSPQVNEEPDAYELLCRISMLPVGTTFQALQSLWAPHIQNLQSPLQALLDTSLLEHSTSTYFVLPVIRSHLLDHEHLPKTVHDSMMDAACRFLQTHDATKPGMLSYKDDMAARSVEEINLQSILLDTTSSETYFIEALLTLAWHQCRIWPRTEVIQHAVKLMSNFTDQKLFGHVLHCYAWILCDLNHSLELLDIADISKFIDSETNEISLIEQAKLELETIHNSKHNQRQRHIFPSLLTLQNRFKKGTRQLKNTHTIDNADLVRCLRDLGRAYSRQGDYSKAIEHLIHAHELCPELSFDGALCAQNLAWSHYCLQQHNEAEKWGLLVLKEYEEMGASDVSLVLWLLGMIYISKGQYDQAIEYLTEGLDRAQARNDEWYIAHMLLQLGRAQMKKGETEDARKFFIKALVHFGPLEFREELMVVCRFYLAKLDDSSRLPTKEERHALRKTSHGEDIPL